MNETPIKDHPVIIDHSVVKDCPVDTASAKSRHKAEKSLSNRILGYAFLASVVVNLGWVALVSHSHLFGKGSSPMMLHEKPIKVFKPIPVKPKPKMLKPPPPPPKMPKVQPKIKPLAQHVHPHPALPRPVTYPAPPRPVTHPAAHPAPPHPVMPLTPRPASHPVQVHMTKNRHAISKQTAKSGPASPGPISPGPAKSGPANSGPANPGPMNPGPASPGPTSPGPAKSEPAPPAQGKPEPAKVEKPKIADTPPAVHHPSNWVPIDSREAALPDGMGEDVKKDDIDSNSLTNDKVLISFTIDETGHVRNARIKESCGNPELDNRILEAVQRAHCTPAIQDHIPHEAHLTKPFSVGIG